MNNQHRIAALNDQFRKGDSSLGQWVISAGVSALSTEQRESLLQAVQSYDNFTQDNDPYGEHDFGMIHLGKEEYFWEIICYDKSSQQLAAHPEDFNIVTRVLTLMEAEEYYTTSVKAPAPRNQPVLS